MEYLKQILFLPHCTSGATGICGTKDCALPGNEILPKQIFQILLRNQLQTFYLCQSCCKRSEGNPPSVINALSVSLLFKYLIFLPNASPSLPTDLFSLQLKTFMKISKLSIVIPVF